MKKLCLLSVVITVLCMGMVVPVKAETEVDFMAETIFKQWTMIQLTNVDTSGWKEWISGDGYRIKTPTSWQSDRKDGGYSAYSEYGYYSIRIETEFGDTPIQKACNIRVKATPGIRDAKIRILSAKSAKEMGSKSVALVLTTGVSDQGNPQTVLTIAARRDINIIYVDLIVDRSANLQEWSMLAAVLKSFLID